MFNLTTTAPLSLFVSLAALTGVTVHDTKADKLTTSIIAMPSIMASTEGASKLANLDSSAHTHVERVSLNDMKSSHPRLAPRVDYKKHLMQKNMPKGAHRYDGYALPLA
jgi:hypothetical protein